MPNTSAISRPYKADCRALIVIHLPRRLGKLVVERGPAAVGERQHFIDAAADAELRRGQRYVKLSADDAELLAQILRIDPPAFLVDLPALQHQRPTLLPLRNAQHVLEISEPRTVQVLKQVRHRQWHRRRIGHCG